MALPNELRNQLYGPASMRAKALPAHTSGPIPTFTRFIERPGGVVGSMVSRIKSSLSGGGIKLTGKEYLGVLAGYDPVHGIVDPYSHAPGSPILNRYRETLASRNILPGTAQAARGFGLEISAGGRKGIIQFPNLVGLPGGSGQILSNSTHFVSKKAYYNGRLYDAAELTETVVKRAMQGELFNPLTGASKKINPAMMQDGKRLASKISKHISSVTRFLTHQAAESRHDVPRELRTTGTYQDVLVGNVFVDMETKNKMTQFNAMIRNHKTPDSVSSMFGSGGAGYKWLEDRQSYLSKQLGHPVSFHTQKAAGLAAGEWVMGTGPQDYSTWGGASKDAGTARQVHRISPLAKGKVKAFRAALSSNSAEYLMMHATTTMTAAKEAAIAATGGKIFQQNIRVNFLLDKKGAKVFGGGMEAILASPELLSLMSQGDEKGRAGYALWLEGQKAMVAGELDRSFSFKRKALYDASTKNYSRVRRRLSDNIIRPHALARMKTGDPANILGIFDAAYIEGAYETLDDRRLKRVLTAYAKATGREAVSAGTKLGRQIYSLRVPNFSGTFLESNVPTDITKVMRAFKFMERRTGLNIKDFIVNDPKLGRMLSVVIPMSVRDIPVTNDVSTTRGDIAKGYKGFFRSAGGFKITIDEPAMARIQGRTKLAAYYENILGLANRNDLLTEIARPLESRLGVKLGGNVPTMSVEQLQIKYGNDLEIWRGQINKLRVGQLKATVLTEEIAKTQLFQDLIEQGFYLEASKTGKLGAKSMYVPRMGIEHDLRIGEISEELKRTAKLLSPSDLPIHIRMSKFEEDWFNVVAGKGGLAQRIMEPRIGGTFRATLVPLGTMGSQAARIMGTEASVFLEDAEKFLAKREYIEVGTRKAKMAKLMNRIKVWKDKGSVTATAEAVTILQGQIDEMSTLFDKGSAIQNLKSIAEKKNVGSMEDFVIVSKDQFKKLTKVQRAYYYKHGYVPSMLRRYPITSSGSVIPMKAILAADVSKEVVHVAQHNVLRLFGDFDLDKGLLEFLQGEEGFQAFEEAYKLDRSSSGAAQRVAAYIMSSEVGDIPSTIKEGDMEKILAKSLGKWEQTFGPKGLASGAAIAAAAQQTHIGQAHSIVNRLGYFYLADALSSEESRRTGMSLKQLARQEQVTRGFVGQLMLSYKHAEKAGLPNFDVFQMMVSAQTKGKIEREEFNAVFGQVLDQMEKGGPILYPDVTIPELRAAHESKFMTAGTAKQLTHAQQAIEDTYQDFNKGLKAHLKYVKEESKIAPTTLKLMQEIKSGLQAKSYGDVERTTDALRKLFIHSDLLTNAGSSSAIVIAAGRSAASDSGVSAVNRTIQQAGKDGFSKGGPVDRRLSGALERGMQFIRKHPVGAALAGAALIGATHSLLSSSSGDLGEDATQQMMKDPRMRGGMLDTNAARTVADSDVTMQFIPQERIHRGPGIRGRVFQRGIIESFPEASQRPDGIIVNGRIPSSFEMSGINDSIDSSFYT